MSEKRIRRSWHNMKMTDQEYKAFKRLAKLSLDWPAGCWLSANTAGVQILRTGEDGKPEIVVTVDIPTDYDPGEIMAPLGWEAGQPLKAADVVKSLAIEMLGHRSDLLELATKRAKDDQERAAITEQAELLEKYAAALNAVAVQMDSRGYQVDHMAGLLELADKHGITLPAWMKGPAQS